ncbi:8b770b31-18ca-4d36-aa65-f269dbab8099 [Thermothielavioides terrestris]|uniref:8b770b31-18ca-4d36-aa65-f269dbab8099 n=1 Tax=Thermothielavioides terrestris TaxID=2587410 RepID=A0A446BFM0_9PEZI|nr:8b770b31-18ca-4d36-aa65-f269dbab8099 [Thermothielavioides terrestris]
MDTEKQMKAGGQALADSPPYLVFSLPAEDRLPKAPSSQDVDGAFDGLRAPLEIRLYNMSCRGTNAENTVSKDGQLQSSGGALQVPRIFLPSIPVNAVANEFHQVVKYIATAYSVYLSGQFGLTLMNSGVTQLAAYQRQRETT